MQHQFSEQKPARDTATQLAPVSSRPFRLSHAQMLDALPYTSTSTGRISSSEPSRSNTPKSGR
jgi:hypothetical protein